MRWSARRIVLRPRPNSDALLDHFFLPMVIWLIGAAYLSAQFPTVPSWLWLVGFIMLTTVLSVLGIRMAAGANFPLVRPASTSFINFGAFTAFTLVNLSVIAHYVRHRRSVLTWLVVGIIHEE